MPRMPFGITAIVVTSLVGILLFRNTAFSQEEDYRGTGLATIASLGAHLRAMHENGDVIPFCRSLKDKSYQISGIHTLEYICRQEAAPDRLVSMADHEVIESLCDCARLLANAAQECAPEEFEEIVRGMITFRNKITAAPMYGNQILGLALTEMTAAVILERLVREDVDLVIIDTLSKSNASFVADAKFREFVKAIERETGRKMGKNEFLDISDILKEIRKSDLPSTTPRFSLGNEMEREMKFGMFVRPNLIQFSGEGAAHFLQRAYVSSHLSMILCEIRGAGNAIPTDSTTRIKLFNATVAARGIKMSPEMVSYALQAWDEASKGKFLDMLVKLFDVRW